MHRPATIRREVAHMRWDVGGLGGAWGSPWSWTPEVEAQSCDLWVPQPSGKVRRRLPDVRSMRRRTGLIDCLSENKTS